ncbi:hypothetical protein LX64_02056 [Chitinophaga skermanii]|uniref:Lysylphosphatidylglycerol synthase-like protein n=1 Tax=Chitinophaga skermanii TaxID=331697 RepID=A0A327QSK1_9BACT|nr:lysylphosphatidylglycerol synthase transmembrane domain-containing protein [Chitinophaga skermanii]RAJ06928.1 hypothetical protein LX64_02056 [Chitinophaga skermanii]
MQQNPNYPTGNSFLGFIKKALRLLVFLGLGLLLIWLALKDLEPGQKAAIVESFKAANYWLILPAFVIGFFSHWVRAIRWRLLMRSLGYNPTLWNTFFAVMIGYLANLAVPRLGEVARCGILARYEKLPADKLVGTIIAERAVDLLSLILLFAITILSQVDVVYNFLETDILIPLQAKIAAMDAKHLMILAGIAIAFVLILIYLGRKFAKSAAAIKIKEIIRNVWDGIIAIGKMPNKGWFIFHSIFIWFLYFGMMYVGFFTLGETSHLGVKAGMALLAFGSIGMIVTPGGIGAYPLIIQKIMPLYKVPAAAAYAFSWIIWGAQTLLILILGLFSLIILPIYNRNRLK